MKSRKDVHRCGDKTVRKTMIIVSSACFICLTLFQPAGSKTVIYGVRGELSKIGQPLEANTGVPLGLSRIDGEKLSFPQRSAAGAGHAASQRAIFALDYHRSPIDETLSPGHYLKENRSVLDLVDSRLSPSREDIVAKSKKAEIDPKVNNLPGKFIPFPVNESVMLLLIGGCMILLAGLGMKTYRKIMSNI